MTHSEHVRRTARVAMILCTLAFSALFVARGAVRLASAAFLPELSIPRSSVRAPPLGSGMALAEAILKRNIFDSEVGPMSIEAPAVASLPPLLPPPDDLDAELPVCEGELRLVAAMVVPKEPELSFASITEQGQTSMYKPGMQVGGREVVGIREQRVFLRGASASTCQLAMFSPAQPAKSASPVTNIAQPRHAAPAPDERITRQGEGSFRIARSLFEQAIAGGSSLASAARVVPQREGDRMTGLKLAGVRGGSLLEQLGLQSGDVLHSINGHDMSSPDAALEAYAKLRQADHFSVTLTRAGQRRSFEYTID